MLNVHNIISPRYSYKFNSTQKCCFMHHEFVFQLDTQMRHTSSCVTYCRYYPISHVKIM